MGKTKDKRDKIRIRILGDPILRKSLRKVSKVTPKILEIIDDMWYVLEKPQGAGLAACQIGIDKRIIVVNTGRKDEKIALINPEIVEASEKTSSDQEGCLSIPGFAPWVTRPYEVKVKGLGVDGKEIQFKAKSIYAKALQHEIDHINGILLLDRVKKEEVLPVLKYYDIKEDHIEYKMLEESKLRPVKKPTLYDAQGNLIR